MMKYGCLKEIGKLQVVFCKGEVAKAKNNLMDVK